MITEDYVSFETAKLLKEKGFDVPCLAHWYIGSEAHEEFSYHPFNWNEVKSDLDWLSRPTQQMAMRWLREEKAIIVNVWYNGVDWDAEYYNSEDEDFYLITEFSCSSYEEACEAVIKYCLKNLIE